MKMKEVPEPSARNTGTTVVSGSAHFEEVTFPAAFFLTVTIAGFSLQIAVSFHFVIEPS